MKQVTKENVLAVLNANMEDLEITLEQLEDNLSDLGMDSIGFIRIVVALEEEFECEIPDSKLQISELNTVQKIIDVLQALNDESVI